eukprot:2356021-Alexandrium_andersonii.AAC.1
MVLPRVAGSSSPGASIVSYYEDPGLRPHPNPGECLYVFCVGAAPAPVLGAAPVSYTHLTLPTICSV